MTASRIAVLGTGEAGWAIATDLAASGAEVTVFDPVVTGTPPGSVAAVDDASAAAGASLVLSLTTASQATGALTNVCGTTARGTVYVDLNTSGPDLKRALAERAGAAGLRFADGAIMSTVPGAGVAVPILAAGPGAAAFADVLNPLGGDVTVIDGRPGDAAMRKLVRSVYYKGMSAAILEAIAAAEALGVGDWLRDMIRRDLRGFGVATLDRIEDGSRRHAGRRAVEMDAATDLLTTLDVHSDVAQAAATGLRRLAGARPPER